MSFFLVKCLYKETKQNTYRGRLNNNFNIHIFSYRAWINVRKKSQLNVEHELHLRKIETVRVSLKYYMKNAMMKYFIWRIWIGIRHHYCDFYDTLRKKNMYITWGHEMISNCNG